MVHLTQTTSPQVLMYASIDAARQQMATRGEELWGGAVELADWARAELNGITGVRCLGREFLRRDGVAEFDPTRLTISTCDIGHTGYQLETILRDDYRIAVEAADPLNVVLNVTYGDRRADLELVAGAFRDSRRASAGRTAAAGPRPPAPACWPAAGLHAPGDDAARRLLRALRAAAAGAVRRPRERRDGHPLPAGHPGAGARRGDLGGDRRLPRGGRRRRGSRCTAPRTARCGRCASS